jgi:hypothetical protein
MTAQICIVSREYLLIIALSGEQADNKLITVSSKIEDVMSNIRCGCSTIRFSINITRSSQKVSVRATESLQ